MSTQPDHQITPAWDLFGKSYDLVKRNLNLFAMLYFVPLALAIADSLAFLSDKKDDTSQMSWNVFVSSLTPGREYGGYAPGSAVLAVLLGVASIIAALLTIIAVVKVAKGHKPTLKSIWQEFTQKGLKLFIVQILVVLIFVAGLIALIVPGVIFLGRLFLAPYLLVDQNIGITESLSKSWEMTKGRLGAVYGVILVSIVLGFAGIIPLVGSILATLLAAAYSVAPALRYLELKKIHN